MTLLPVVVLAGGLATRLRPITEEIPKALVQVGGQPFIVQQLRLLHSHGVRRAIIALWYKGEMIRDLLGDGAQLGMSIEYVHDGDAPLGTGGAVRRAIPLVSGPFFLLYGDSYLPCAYREIQGFFMRHDRRGLMTVFRNRNRWEQSNVELRSGEIVRYDKNSYSPAMEYVDYGLGVFQPHAFSRLQEGQAADLTEVYQALLAERQLLAYSVKDRFYEVGSLEGIRVLDELLSEDRDRFLYRAPQ